MLVKGVMVVILRSRTDVVERAVPADMQELAVKKRKELIGLILVSVVVH